MGRSQMKAHLGQNSLGEKRKRVSRLARTRGKMSEQSATKVLRSKTISGARVTLVPRKPARPPPSARFHTSQAASGTSCTSGDCS